MATFLNCLKKISVIVLAILISQVALASSEDDYLKQLELEAGDEPDDMSAVQSEGEEGNSSSDLFVDMPTTEKELILNKKKLIVDINTFEAALKSTYPDSYALYVQLNETQRKLLYQEFTEHKRLSNSSLKAISIYLDSH